MCSWDSECSVKSDDLSYADPSAARSRQVPKSLRKRVYTGVQCLLVLDYVCVEPMEEQTSHSAPPSIAQHHQAQSQESSNEDPLPYTCISNTDKIIRS